MASAAAAGEPGWAPTSAAAGALAGPPEDANDGQDFEKFEEDHMADVVPPSPVVDWLQASPNVDELEEPEAEPAAAAGPGVPGISLFSSFVVDSPVDLPLLPIESATVAQGPGPFASAAAQGQGPASPSAAPAAAELDFSLGRGLPLGGQLGRKRSLLSEGLGELGPQQQLLRQPSSPQRGLHVEVPGSAEESPPATPRFSPHQRQQQHQFDTTPAGSWDSPNSPFRRHGGSSGMATSAFQQPFAQQQQQQQRGPQLTGMPWEQAFAGLQQPGGGFDSAWGGLGLPVVADRMNSTSSDRRLQPHLPRVRSPAAGAT